MSIIFSFMSKVKSDQFISPLYARKEIAMCLDSQMDRGTMLPYPIKLALLLQSVWHRKWIRSSDTEKTLLHFPAPNSGHNV